MLKELLDRAAVTLNINLNLFPEFYVHVSTKKDIHIEIKLLVKI